MALSGAQKHDIIRLYDIPGDRIEVVGAGYNEALFRPRPKPAPDPVHQPARQRRGELREREGEEHEARGAVRAGELLDPHAHRQPQGGVAEERQALAGEVQPRVAGGQQTAHRQSPRR